MIYSLFVIRKLCIFLSPSFRFFLCFHPHPSIVSGFIQPLLTFLFQSLRIKLIIWHLEEWVCRGSIFLIDLRSSGGLIFLFGSFDGCFETFHFFFEFGDIAESFLFDTTLEIAFSFVFGVGEDVAVVEEVVFVLG